MKVFVAWIFAVVLAGCSPLLVPIDAAQAIQGRWSGQNPDGEALYMDFDGEFVTLSGDPRAEGLRFNYEIEGNRLTMRLLGEEVLGADLDFRSPERVFVTLYQDGEDQGTIEFSRIEAGSQIVASQAILGRWIGEVGGEKVGFEFRESDLN